MEKITKLEEDLLFYQDKFEQEKELKNNTNQKMRELKMTLRQLTT